MNTTFIVLAAVAGAILLGAIVVGTALFSPRRAAAAKISDTATTAKPTRDQIVRLGIPPPVGIAHTLRLDRHPAYVWPHIGLLLVGVGVIMAPAPNSAVVALSWDAQKLLGVCMLTGSTIALIGSSLGLGMPGERYIFRGITDNVTSLQLGDDIRVPYALGCLGLLSVGVSMAGYAWTIYQYSTLVGALGGGLTFALMGMCLNLAGLFVARMRRYSHDRDRLLSEARRRLGEEQ